MVKTVVIAGTHSGVGKTSLSVGIMLALRQRGLVVQPFKVGPDFLDPQHHAAACGRPSVNLDGWMLNRQQVLDSFNRHTAGADVAVVEGVMGLFDSRDGASDDGSTAQIAKWLGAPVVLVVDCWAMARSAAAVVKGFAEFDADCNVCGVLLNKVGSAAHGAWLSQALDAAWQQQRFRNQVLVLGCIPKDESVSVPERYLGLTMPHEQGDNQRSCNSTDTPGSETAGLPSYLQRLADHIKAHVDLDKLLDVAAAAGLQSQTADAHNEQQNSMPDGQCQQPGWTEQAVAVPRAPAAVYSCRIAVARDEAFCFYYQDNLALLAAAGAELVMFSPLRDAHLPRGISGIYLGGGYPERHAQELAGNTSLLSEVRQWASAGGVVYAECGGLIYLCKGYQPADVSGGDTAPAAPPNSSSENCITSTGSGLIPLAGVLPFGVCMGRMKMGYVEVELLQGNPLFPPGCHVRGQVYHFTQLLDGPTQCSSSDTSSTSSSSTRADGNGGKQGSDHSNSDNSSSTNSSASVAAPEAAPEAAPPLQNTYRLQHLLPGAQPMLEGYTLGNVLASYVHLHWGGCPELAAALVAKCCETSRSCLAGAASSPVSGRLSLTATGTEAVSKPACFPLGQTEAAVSADASRIQAAAGKAAAAAAGRCDEHTPQPFFCTTSCCCSSKLATSSSSASLDDKIVSFLPSGTEILYALGLQDRLVGVSGFCDWPHEARLKPCAVRSLIDVDALSSDEIEAAMQAFKAAGESPFQVDTSLLKQQQPSLVLTQDACGTCDADCSVVCRAMQQAGLTCHNTQVLVLHPKTLSEVFDSLVLIGTAAGVADRAHQLAEELLGRLEAVAAAIRLRCPAAAAITVDKASTAGMVRPSQDMASSGEATAPGRGPHSTYSSDISSSGDHTCQYGTQQAPQQQQEGSDFRCWQGAPRVLSLEGLCPLVLGGQWLPDVKLAAGAVDASGQVPGESPVRISWEQVVAYAPDVLLLCPCSRSPSAAMPDVTCLTQLPGFRDLPAVANHRVYVVDHSLFSRPGPRLVEGVELLHKLVWEQPCSVQGVKEDQPHQMGAEPAPTQPGGCVLHPVEQGVNLTSLPGRHASDSNVTVTTWQDSAAGATLAASGGAGDSFSSAAQSGCEPHVLRIECLPDGPDICWVPLQL